MANFPNTYEFSREDWETMSQIPSLSSKSGRYGKRPEGRNLDLEADYFIVSQVFLHGAPENAPTGLQARNLDGVVVVTNNMEQADGGSDLRRLFVRGFVPAEALQHGISVYTSMIERLQQALDSEDRLQALEVVRTKGRAFFGLDLGYLPADMPLIHFCAKHGFAECVDALLQVDGFQQSLAHRCKHRFTLLHFVAWGGHSEVLGALGYENVKKLCDVPNEYGELPETSALIRAVELRGDQPTMADACEAVAIQLRQHRTGTHVTLQTFVHEANAILNSASREDKLMLPYCVEASAVTQSFTGRFLRCSEFVARHVDIVAALPTLLTALQDNFNLERLVLEHCNLTHMEAESLADFFVNFPFTLASVELVGNPLSDDGVCKLADSGALRCIQCLSLGTTGMTLRGLAALAPSLTAGCIEKLLVGDNDFEATDADAMALFQTFADAIKESKRLVELDMGKTRLQAQHLHVLAEAIKVAPALQTVKLNVVGLKEEFADTRESRNPLLQALQSASCSVTRLEVHVVEYPDIFKAFKRAVRQRMEGGGKGSKKGGGKVGGSRDGSCGKGSGKGSELNDPVAASTSLVSHCSDQVLHFPQELLARVELSPALHPNFKPSADLYCDSFMLRVQSDQASSELVHGECYRLNVGIAIETCSAQYALGKAVNRQLSFLCCNRFQLAESFPALRSVNLVLHRPVTGTVLLVQQQSEAFGLLMRRLKDFALSTDWVLQDRFGQGGRKLLPRMSFSDVMTGINVSDLTTKEIRSIASADDFEAYLGLIGAVAPTSRHHADHSRYMSDSIFLQLLEHFQAECERRDAAPSMVADWVLPSAPLEGSRVSGRDDQCCVSLASTLEQCLLSYFAGSVGLDGLADIRHSAAMEVLEVGAQCRWKRLLFHVVVPQEMEDGSQAKGQRPSSSRVQWVSVNEVQGFMHDSRLAAAVQGMVQQAAPLSLRYRRSGDAAASLKLRGRALGR